jgi:hypothetical protein
MTTDETRKARHFMGVPIDRLAPGDSRGKYAAFTAQQWVYGNTVEGIKEAMRVAQGGKGRQPNGRTYMHNHHQGES